jgi:purine nucleoside phosphorylase
MNLKPFLFCLFLVTGIFPITAPGAAHNNAASAYPKATIAVLGGTFLNDSMIDSGLLKGTFTIDTRAGPSPEIHHGEVKGIPFYYVHGHGGGKWVEMFAALHDLGVKEIIGGATAGGINTYLKTYDLVTMNNGTEMSYARQLGIHYACLNLISNPAEGIGEWDWGNLKYVYQRMNLVCLDIVTATIPRIAAIDEDEPRAMDGLLRMKRNFTYKEDPAEAADLPFATD